MFFVTVGSLEMEFSRLINALDKLPEKYKNEILFQGYIGKNTRPSFKSVDFLTRIQYMEYFINAEIIISHAGMGTIYESIKLCKKTIILPRLADYKEHFNNHQQEVFNKLQELKFPNLILLDNFLRLSDNIETLLKRKVDYTDFKLGDSLKVQLSKDIDYFSQ